MKRTLTLVLMILLGSIPATAQTRRPAPALTQAQARVVALARVPGTVQRVELEREHERWSYPFLIRTAPCAR